MSSMLKAAVIGVGSMGKNHARIYYELENTDLVAIADTDEKQGKSIAEKYHCNYYKDYKELAEKEKIDIANICVPTPDHKRVAVDLLNKKINVLVEKPIASTLEEGKAIIDAAKKNKRKLMIGHIERFNPAIIALKKKLDEKKLGKIYKIDIRRVGPYFARASHTGVIIDLAVHDIDILYYLTGSEPERAYAETEDHIKDAAEDLLQASIKFKNNILCGLSVDCLTPTKIRDICVKGEGGMFIADTAKQELYFYKNALLKDDYAFTELVKGVIEGDIIKLKIDIKEPLRAEIESFVECVEKDLPSPVSGEDGLKTLALAFKLLESSKNKKVVVL